MIDIIPLTRYSILSTQVGSGNEVHVGTTTHRLVEDLHHARLELSNHGRVALGHTILAGDTLWMS